MTQRPLADPQVRSHRRALWGCGAEGPSPWQQPVDVRDMLSSHVLALMPARMPTRTSAHRPAHFTGLVLALVWVLALGMSSPARADAVLSQQKNCNACHAMDGAITGPSLKAVAQKYAGDRTAADKLTTRILKGGVGVWGPVPMPANPQLSEAEARRLAVWILGLK